MKEIQNKTIVSAAKTLITAIKEAGLGTSFDQNGEEVMPVAINIGVYKHYDPPKLFIECLHQKWAVRGDYKE
jgi:hypothetical protein